VAAKRGAYLLSPRAIADLEEIWRYSEANWSAVQADRYHAAIVETFEDLASGQRTALPAPVRPGYLKCPVGAHLVYFRATETALVVVRILHQRMDVGRHL
jgi:toxin ParE1/3/4